MKTIYLDNAATTAPRTEVLEAMFPYMSGIYGNPSSIHSLGREAAFALTSARNDIAHALSTEPHEIIFTGSGTEANNLAIVGVARALRARGQHILLSTIEHPSVLRAGEALALEGFDVEYIPVDGEGLVAVEDILRRIRPDTTLISVMLANNEIGTIEPIAELAREAKKKFGNARPFFHTDACQATGQIPIQPSLLGVDLMTVNSSKICGPKGVGMLYVRSGVPLTPVTVGGEQEFGKRGGTENIAGIIGFAKALTLALTEQEKFQKQLTKLRDEFIEKIMKLLPTAIINGPRTNRLPNNIHISIPYIEGESLLLMLDAHGICVSTGSACSAHNLLPSHVLRAIGQSSELIHGSLRFTFGRKTTRADLDYTVRILARSAAELLRISPLPLRL